MGISDGASVGVSLLNNVGVSDGAGDGAGLGHRLGREVGVIDGNGDGMDDIVGASLGWSSLMNPLEMRNFRLLDPCANKVVFPSFATP